MKLLMISRMSDTIEATFSHAWGNIDAVESVVVVRGKQGLPHPKVKYIEFPLTIDRIALLRSILQFIVAFFICVSLKPDIICGLHMSPQGYYSHILSRLFRKPLVLHLVSESQGGLNLRRYSQKQSSLIKSAFALNAAKRADAITTTGNTSQRRIILQGIPKYRVYVSPSIIDTTQFHPMSLPKKYDLIIISRLSWEKNIDTFLHVVKNLSEHYPIRAAIAGVGPDRIRLKKLAEELNVTENVEFLGWIDSKELNTLYNSATIFLLTSITEGFPTTISEALCSGLCVISSDVGDIATVVEHEVNGFLVSRFDDVDKYVQYIRLVLDDTSIVNKMAQASHSANDKLSYSTRTTLFRQILQDIHNR